MDARYARWIIVGAALASLAADYRTENFVVSAPTAAMAADAGETAEALRRELALEWLGAELPRWEEPCPIRAIVRADMPAGGQTSFYFTDERPRGWEMIVQGSRERVLDSVLPHEITHTIFATHFGQPLPRWADEGACTTVEHVSERAKQDRLLVQFLTTQPTRGIAFNEMFAMREYPRDILPLYSQGYSLAQFLIAQGGKRKFVQYVGEGLRTNNWTAATREHYAFQSLADLQGAWLRWVGQGSPPIAERPAASLVSFPSPQAETNDEGPSRLGTMTGGHSSGSAESWYARRRDETRGDRPLASPERDLPRAASRPQAVQPLQPLILEAARTAQPDGAILRR